MMEINQFKFSVGDIVSQENDRMRLNGILGVIRWRRNAYPEPWFTGFWFPLYMVDNLVPAILKGQEIHENCLRLATEEEKDSLILKKGSIDSVPTEKPDFFWTKYE